ncbi:hypothetical protein G9A89_013474 [Geosiphon pyriformis]|nr:hypothetical protein G9A89_013474 [Geosiphon pyriformis]
MKIANMVTGISGSGLTGLETYLSTKKKHVDSIYFYSTSYKKLKKPVVIGIVDLSAGLLSLVDFGGADSKSVMINWGLKANNKLITWCSVTSLVDDISKIGILSLSEDFG